MVYSILMKKIYFIALLLFSFSLCMTGCLGLERKEPITKTGFYFNTAVTITVYSEKDAQLLPEAFSLCQHYEKLLSRTIEGSDIWNINLSEEKSVSVSEETIELLNAALFYASLSQGRIDPTVAPLMDLWNFTSGEPGPVPASSDIEVLLPHVDYKNIIIEENTVTLKDSKTQLDLGFLAKGYIADKVRDFLLENGVENAIIDLGGNLVVMGSKPDGSIYKLGIQKPFAPTGEMIYSLSVTDTSLVTSGTYERFFEENGRNYHHILNTSTGYPIENDLLSVSILTDSSLEADALSTTCFVLGLEEGMELIESLPDVEAVFITDDYELHFTSEFHQ